MKPKLLVTTYEDNLDRKQECEIVIKDLEQDIVNAKRTVDRILKSIQHKTNILAARKTALQEHTRFLDTNKMRYIDCKSSVMQLDKLLKQQEKIQEKINKARMFSKLFGR